MKSVVSVKGQTVVPKEIRDKLGIQANSKLLWFVKDGSAVVSVLPDDPIGAMKGIHKDMPYSTADLLAERRAERDKEEAAVEGMRKRWRSTP